MRVLHIIPSAFDYFDGIRFESFKILEMENKFGIDTDAITLEYGSSPKSSVSSTTKSFPRQKFLGRDTIDRNVKEWDQYDVVNLHCPFFGGAKKILDWAGSNDKNLVLTYHCDFVSSDIIGWFIKIYNYFYLPKLAKKSKLISLFSSRYYDSKIGIKIFKNCENIAVLGLGKNFKDIHSKEVVEDLVMVYNSIVKDFN